LKYNRGILESADREQYNLFLNEGVNFSNTSGLYNQYEHVESRIASYNIVSSTNEQFISTISGVAAVGMTSESNSRGHWM
jgi:hypothetical protein